MIGIVQAAQLEKIVTIAEAATVIIVVVAFVVTIQLAADIA